MKVSKITSVLEQLFPISLQMDFDNCGLQVGSFNSEVSKVMVGLNCDIHTVNSAIQQNCQLLITHHPLFFNKPSRINVDDNFGEIIQKAIKNDLTIYSLHTCLDIGQDGNSMNDWLIRLFDVSNVSSYDQLNLGKKAVLNESKTVLEFIDILKDKFNINHLKYAGREDKIIKKIAIVGGSGSDDIYKLKGKVDALISGDSKYHLGQFALENDMILFDVGHHIEVIFEKEMRKIIEQFNIEVIEANSKDYFKIK